MAIFFGATHMLYETTVPTGVVVEISWEHEAYVWMTEEEFAHSPAIDEFMHKVQERLLSAGELHPVTA